MVAPAPADELVEIEIAPGEAGERIDKVLAARDLGWSRSRIQNWIGEGRVEADGEVVRAKSRAVEGSTVTVRPAPPEVSDALPQDIPLDLMHEDEHLLVVCKPAGMVVHPAPGHPDGTLVNALLHHAGALPAASREGAADAPARRPGIVHRLDKDTSGVMVVAKTEAARDGLVALLKDHDVEREYEAIVLGHPATNELRFETLHGRHPRDRKRFSGRVRQGKPAITEARVLQRMHASAHLRCRLQTGRTHQIRVHLSEASHPVLADELYGRRSKDPRCQQAAAAIGRQALHARLLGFVHPVTGEPMRFEQEPPADFRAALDLLRDR